MVNVLFSRFFYNAMYTIIIIVMFETMLVSEMYYLCFKETTLKKKLYIEYKFGNK